MPNWKNTLITPETPILEAVRLLDGTAAQICLVTSGNGKLLGTVTDGDIRRGILRSMPLSDPVVGIMNPKPYVTSIRDTREARVKMMTSLSVHQIPIVDGNGCVVGLETLEALVAEKAEHKNWVVLMAGGLGSRLRPLTENTPKPLLQVGNKPILETILEGFVRQNFNQFYISVNYKADLITSHFGEGDAWSAKIKYLHEDEPLGTAASLRLIKERPTEPLIIMNADLLTKVNFEYMLDYHREHQATATVGVREYDFQVPFGVVSIDGNKVRDIEEKPVHRFFVNAGIYIIEPEALDLIPDGGSYDMTEFINVLAKSKDVVSVFPIREYWLDIGQADDFKQANQEFQSTFG